MKRKDIKKTIAEYFFINPSSKLRVREIERTLRLPLPSVIRYCREMNKEGILSINKIGNVTFYTAGRSFDYFLEKRFFNIRQIYKSGIVDYLKTELSNPVIVLFGSYSKGEDIESSDIDLYIETASKKAVNIEKFKKILKKDIQLLRHKSIKEVKNPYLANNIINGTTLNNQLEVFR